MSRIVRRHLGFIPVPALILIVAALHFIVKPSLFFEPAWLLPITNTLFVTVVCFIIAYIAVRNYRSSGRIQVLLLGCGVLGFGIAAVVAAFLRSVPGAGANLNVTIYNTGALLGAIFHFIAALILLAGISPEAGSKRKELWALLSYAGLTVFVALFTMASIRGIIPPFFVQGIGATALRQEVLGTADLLFAFSFLIFMGAYLRNGEVFLYWYASALALTSISLTGFLIQSAVGSPIGWASRFSQYLGGIYFLIAVISAVRSAQARRISFDRVLTASLSPAEEQFRALSEDSPDCISRFDRETKLVYINPAGLELYGKGAGSIIGKTIEETGLPEDYCSLLKERMGRVLATGRPMEAEGHLPAGKETRFYQSRCVPEYAADGSVAYVLVVSRDLTDRKRAEEALRASEERYRSLFNGMTEGFALHEIVCDEKGKPCDYIFLEINPAFERLTGLKRDDVMGKAASEVLPHNEPYWVETYGTVALTGQPVEFESYSSPFKRHYGVFAYSPAPRQFAVLFMDTTDRRHAEEALRRGMQRFELLTETAGTLLRAPDPQRIVEALARKTMEYLDCHAFLNFLVVDWAGKLRLNAYAGIPEEQARLIEWLDYGVAVCGCAARDACRIVAEHIPTTHDVRTELVKSYGIKAYACHPLLGPEGKVMGTLSFGTRSRETFSDEDLALMKAVTDQVAVAMIRMKNEDALKRAHGELELRVEQRTAELQQAYERLTEETKERERAEAQLRQAQKMEALGTLSGGIAHDFNNMLAAIIGFTELVAGHAAKGSRDERHLKRVMEASLRGRELVRQMLTFSRRTEQEKKPLRLSSIIKETVKLLRASTPTTISIRVNALSESDLILGDPTQIQQVLMNLCTNASYAMREKGGILDVELRDFSVRPSNGNTHGIKPGLYVKLTVRDTGAGMSPDIMERIFDPFFTTKALGEGTGLGLSVVHGIVEQHDGYITVESEPDKGSVFTLYFPQIAGELQTDAVSDGEIPTGSERILFVDDEEALVEMGEDILAELGYQITSRLNSREALALLKVDPSRFDLVITDQTMPEMTGFELAKEILAFRADMPIIMCTGFSHLVDADKAKAAGIRAFAMKPLTKREIAKTIRKVLDE